MIQRPQSDYSTLGPVHKYPYECKHSTYIYLFFITLNSLYVEAAGGLFVHYIVNHVLFGLYI